VKSRPTLKNLTLTLDERFRPSLQTDKGHFDLWFRFTGLTARPVKTDLKMPLKAHRAYKKFLRQGWEFFQTPTPRGAVFLGSDL
jgi:hypothetical protein